MEIIHFFESDKQTQLVSQISACEWSAARFLVELLENGTFHEMLGGWGELYLLMDGENLASFATLSGQDSVRDEGMTPWIGFVYTVPEYRGHRYAGHLLSHACSVAADRGFEKVYIATDHVGLYEKYGFAYQENRIDYWGNDQQVLNKDVEVIK